MQVGNVPPRIVDPPAVGGADETRLTLFGRLILITGGLVLLSTFVVATRLEPDQQGFGTHVQIPWLAPCGFRAWSGLPCPSCGMTTAWAHLVRGQWRMAWSANAWGCGLALAAAIVGPWGLLSGLRGRWIVATPQTRHVLWAVIGLGLLGLGYWLGQLIRTL